MLRPQHLPSGRLIVPVLVFMFATCLCAQTRSHRNLSSHPHFTKPADSSQQAPESLRAIAFAHAAPLPIVENQSADRAMFLPPSRRATAHDPVNLHLLLPSSGILPSWASTNLPSKQDLATVFAPDPPPPSTELPARFNDVQFYTRHIPGVAPIVDRFFQEKKAHPNIVRVFQYLHPKF